MRNEEGMNIIYNYNEGVRGRIKDNLKEKDLMKVT